MSSWFDPNSYTPEPAFRPIPVGDHRVRIVEVEETKSRAGAPMLKLTLEVSGYKGKLFDYIVQNEWAQKKVGEILESAALLERIKAKGFSPNLLKLAAGGVKVTHEDYNGEASAKVAYWLRRSKVNELPPWQAVTDMPQKVADNSQEVDHNDIPF